MDFNLELRKDINYINIMRYNIKIHKMFEQNIKKLVKYILLVPCSHQIKLLTCPDAYSHLYFSGGKKKSYFPITSHCLDNVGYE